QNIAEDVTLSGTVAGAIEGMSMGIPSIALSQSMNYFHDEIVAHWETAQTYGPGIIQRLLEVGWPADVIMNINFPSLPPEEVTAVEVTRQGFRDGHLRHWDKRTDLRGRDYYWMGFTAKASEPAPGTDLKAVYEGKISVTPLHIDLTHNETVHALKGVLGGAPPKLRVEA
ncbi:MAG: 5'/3'-nucleotidase SurE, partial [Caulobacter sp. 12-67-6]